MLSCGPGPSSFVNTSLQLADVLPRDLLQRAEPLRVVGAAVHQPVVRARVHQHLRRHRRERRPLRPRHLDQRQTFPRTAPGFGHNDMISRREQTRRQRRTIRLAVLILTTKH